YLVTGGAGFIGSHIVRRLVADGHRVRILDNLSTGSMDKLADVIDRAEFIEGDLREQQDCQAACAGVEMVFHEAALPSVPRSVEDPQTFHANNIDGTFQLFLAAKEAGCRRIIYAASSSAYGDQPTQPKLETMLPAPLSPYALNKLVGEYYARVFYESYGLETISLRYFNVFGPHQDPSSQYAAAISAFVSAILRGERPIVYGDGQQTRDFTHIDNVVEANMLAAAAKTTQGQVINIACGQSVTINQVINTINRLLGTDHKPEYVPPRAGDIMHSLADITLAHEVIGFKPHLMFEDGLARAIEWYKANL
ncbi:MAG: SDR family oxidoreductase, partial [Planctomycetes bacterium]|nr:SDR family oxidoreductase [Planctomycetota bacterium]